jgi:hypothetical protein
MVLKKKKNEVFYCFLLFYGFWFLLFFIVFYCFMVYGFFIVFYCFWFGYIMTLNLYVKKVNLFKNKIKFKNVKLIK